ncbi:MAG: PKD domain-containing protein, partial [Bacteroidota bacterium]
MRKTFLLLLLGIAATKLSAQCDLIDGQGNDSPNPVWVSCTGGAFTLFVQSNSTFGAYSIDWGDGSAVTTGTALVPPNFVTHTYAATIDTFNLTFTSGGCTINGLVVMEEPVNASIQIPIGGVTQICAPGDLQFTNSSTDVSGTTTCIWDFGDGSPPQVFGPGNLGQTVTHTYQQGTVDCVTQVTLTAENFCSFGNPTVASFNPVQIFDLDDAQIAASAVLLCYPDTVVHFDNVTNRNCVPQGNVQQRFEFWNFGNHWGTGQDSIIDWLPFAPPNRPGYDIAFPGIGTYTIMMVDSNMCGRDTAFITIDIVPPPTAAVAANQDTICAGENVTFS